MKKLLVIVGAVIVVFSGCVSGQVSAKSSRYQTIVTTKKTKRIKYYIKNPKQKTVSKLSTTRRQRPLKIKQIKLAKKMKQSTLYAIKTVRVKKPIRGSKWNYTTYVLLTSATGKKVGYVKKAHLEKGKYLTPEQRQLLKGYVTGNVRKQRLVLNKSAVRQLLALTPRQVTTQSKITDWPALNKAVIFGDSIARGREYVDGEATIAAKPFINDALQKIGVTGNIQNYAYSGSGVCAYANKSFPRNLAWQIDNRKFARYPVIFLAYGTNDWGLTVQGKKSLLQVARTLDDDIQKMREQAPDTKILAVLPIDRFNSKHDNLYTNYKVSKQGYTLEELNAVFKQVYQANGIPVFDWHQGQNAAITSYKDMSDGVTHPTKRGYAKMATKLAGWLQQQ
ncbi:SGNH/GDSL hydrolase family protein [Periweissella cryptocerci]|uniref:SGNH/GDSL hydrolase family protein n=1 Tax=Periweissella cryptocerci TaxID=2506420 RepID=A0A4P6YVT7_9LACO|nr:SGNH/GDSL hydrolase family protein [Periweissella cryptocerci]QBO36876.1 SGNH/GDSL hydrolase family protein [Periweissella cryptocerci]